MKTETLLLVANLATLCSPWNNLSEVNFFDLSEVNNTISNMKYQPLTVNHQLHYVDPITYAIMNHFESKVVQDQTKNKHKWKTHCMFLLTYLVEFI